MSDLEALERAVLAAAPEDAPPVSALLSGPSPEAPSLDPAPDAEGFDMAEDAGGDLIDPATFTEQFGQIHDLIGGMVQMQTGQPCPLGDQARSAGGQMAAQACYSLLASTPVLARMFLSPHSTFIGQIMTIGLHGFACVQMVKAARNPPPEATP